MLPGWDANRDMTLEPAKRQRPRNRLLAGGHVLEHTCHQLGDPYGTVTMRSAALQNALDFNDCRSTFVRELQQVIGKNPCMPY